MIDDLRKILNYKLNIESDKNNDEYLFSSCCNNLIYDKDIQLNTKINEIKNCLFILNGRITNKYIFL